jgi:hypothetical protein
VTTSVIVSVAHEIPNSGLISARRVGVQELFHDRSGSQWLEFQGRRIKLAARHARIGLENHAVTVKIFPRVVPGMDLRAPPPQRWWKLRRERLRSHTAVGPLEASPASLSRIAVVLIRVNEGHL